MGLKRVLFEITVIAALLWLMPGCGDSAVSAPSVWGGSTAVSADRAELRNVRWKEIPVWEEWNTLPQKSQIFISGEWTGGGTAEPVMFLCRLVRQSGTLYKIHVNTVRAGRLFSVAGDLDWVRQSAALDFRVDLAAEQFRTYFGNVPELRRGDATVSGSVLLSGDKASFPALTITLHKDSVLQFGSFPMTGGRMERRETFSGKVEFSLYGMTSRAGGMLLRPSEITVDRDRAVFKTSVIPDAPWQSSAALQGAGRCVLTGDGEWSLAAELPEAGVFRNRDLILPLRNCRISGQGDRNGGKWLFHGEGASGSLLQSSGNVTAGNVQISGEKAFTFTEGNSVFLPDTFHVECGKAEWPGRLGRISVTRLKADFQQLPSGGCLQFSGTAGDMAFIRKDGGGVRLQELSWDLPLAHIGNRVFSPETGVLRAKSLLMTGPQGQAQAANIHSSVILKEHSWELGMRPEVLTFSAGLVKCSFAGAELKITGSRNSTGWVEVSGKGDRGGMQIADWSGDCGAWDFHIGLSSDLVHCNLLTWSGQKWLGKFTSGGTWGADHISLKADRTHKDIWRGKWDLAGVNINRKDLAIKGFSGQLPFGGAEAAGCKIRAEQFQYKALTVADTALELQNTADGMSLRGRGRSGLTGGACFITGDIRGDLRHGVVEYSMPAVTLQKELKVAEILPLSGGWTFAGKVGGSGQIGWDNVLFRWQNKYSFSGFARNAACMVEELSGQIELGNGEITDGRMLFRRLTSITGEAADGELQFRTEKKQLHLQEARFKAWGGYWKLLRNGEFQVKGIQLAGLLGLPGWQNAVQGTFSGTLALDQAWYVRQCELKSDAAGSLALAEMEKYRLLPKKEFDMNALAFTTAAFRDFRYSSLNLRLVRRKNGVLLRVAGEGRPAKAVPFVLEKSGYFRPAVSSEQGFDGNVEIGCGYRIPLRDFGARPGISD